MGFAAWAFPVLSPGAEAFWLVAKDQDEDPLTYGISGSNAYFFTVISSTGEVKLASPLDYEVKDSSLRKPRDGDRETWGTLGASIRWGGALSVLSP